LPPSPLIPIIILLIPSSPKNTPKIRLVLHQSLHGQVINPGNYRYGQAITAPRNILFFLALFLCLITAVNGVATVNVATMNELFNVISNDSHEARATGNNLMSAGDTCQLQARTYLCSSGTCAHSKNMFIMDNIVGEIVCVNHAADCVLDAENSKRAMWFRGWPEGGTLLNLMALKFQKGRSFQGGALMITDLAVVSVALCVFDQNAVTQGASAGGAILVYRATGENGGGAKDSWAEV